MTDTSPLSQPVAAPPDDQFGFSYAELLHLLEVSDAPASRLTRGLLRLDDIPERELLARVGASCLLARGLLRFTEDSESVVPVEEALLVAYVLTNATRWTTFQASDGAGGDTGFLIESELGSAIIQPRALDTWWFMLLPTGVPIPELVADTAIGLATQAPEMGIFLTMQTLAITRTFTIHRTMIDWSYAYGVTGAPEPEVQQEEADEMATGAALRAFVGTYPTTDATDGATV